jgi:hypothetical protein
MSEVKKSSIYLDTSVSGLVIQANHNLNGVAYPSFYTLDAGHKVFVSLYDPRIAEFKNLDDNSVQVTFASAFAGYMDLVVYDVSFPSDTDRIQAIEKKLNDLNLLFEMYTPKNSWKQMNNYHDSRFKDMQAQIDDLTVQLDTLRQQVESL